MSHPQPYKTPFYLRTMPLKWNITVDVLAAVSIWVFCAALDFPTLAIWLAPVLWLLITVPVDIWRSRVRARRLQSAT